MLMNRYGFFFQAAIKLGTLPAYKAGWAAAITRHRNHPSIFDWCMGNEGWGVGLRPSAAAMVAEHGMLW